MIAPSALALLLASQDPAAPSLRVPIPPPDISSTSPSDQTASDADAAFPPASYLWQDLDRDGRSDVYVRSPGREDRLLLNRDGSFEDVTERFGLAGLASTLAVTWTDFEHDGLPDLHVVAFDGASRLFHNAGTSFVEVTTSSGVAHDGPAVFHEWLDGDGDDLPDLHVLTPEADVLFKNLGSSRFAAIPLPTGGGGGAGRAIVTIGGGAAGTGSAAPADRPVTGPFAEGSDRENLRSGASGRTTRAVSTSSADTANLGACGTANIDDSGAAGCLQASSVPTLGMLYPLSSDLNVAGTGLVGIGTTAPTQKLDVDGTIRSRTGGIQFPDGSVQASAEALDSAFVYGAGVDPSATLQFLAPPAMVTIASGQRIFVSSNKALGSRYTAGACCLSLWVGYRLTPSGSIVTVGGGMLGNKVNRNTRTVHGVNGVLTGLPAGTYEVGMVGGTADPHWDFNGSGYTSALVFN